MTNCLGRGTTGYRRLLSSVGTFDGYAKTLENKLGDLSSVSRSVASGVTAQSVMAERQANALEKVAETSVVQKEHLEYLKTPSTVTDLDGNPLASIAPRDLKNVANASQSRLTTDVNNFEIDNDDDGLLNAVSSFIKFEKLGDSLV